MNKVFSKKDVDVLAEVYRVLSYNKNNKELQIEVDHIYMKIKKIVENNKGFDELREQSLEDVYYYLCKNEPSKNSKEYKDWTYLEDIARAELLIEDERPNECTEIINEIVDYLEYDWKGMM